MLTLIISSLSAKRLVIFHFVFPFALFAQQGTYKLAVLKYNGGGDYYANPTSLPNLINYCNQTFGTNISKDVPFVEAGSKDIFMYPFVHMTGHGNVFFSKAEADNLRLYMQSGGFLHIDDNYGMDQYVRSEIKKVFPDKELIELPTNHPIFHQKNNFEGLPKIHEHDGKSPQAFAIIDKGRILCLYTYETDLGDGWEDPSVHNDPPEKRQQALKMGANVIMYVFMQ
ncbi:MAG: DUF4159 domain-containing protein [Bacteroidetes bacterium]|nr:DUF4159 domain-containing protein [Bacteroidota bacterium]